MQIPTIKKCERCNKEISWESTSDYYSHIRIMYCSECREIVKREQTVSRMKRLRERKKASDKQRDEELIQLKAENEILRKRLEALWDVKWQNSAGLIQDQTV